MSIHLITISLFLLFFLLIFLLFIDKNHTLNILNNFFNRINDDDKLKFTNLIKKTIIILIAGIIINKILVLVPYLNNLLLYPLINLPLIRITFINLINAVLTFLLFKNFIELGIIILSNSLTKEKIDESNLDDLIRYIGFLISSTLSLAVLGLNLTLLIPIAGALGIGVGFAFQDLLKNLIAGIVILFEKTIKKGDFIKIGDLEGYVKEINLRTVIIKTLTNEEIILPNSYLTQNPLINYSLSEPYIKVMIPFGVSYSSDLDKVIKISLEVAKKYSKKEPCIFLVEYGNNSVNFNLCIWVNIKKDPLLSIKSKIYIELFNKFKENNIEIPFNQVDIWFRNKLKIEK